MHELYELKEKLLEELKEYDGQEMSAGSLEVIDKLAHAIKNICKIIESSEYSGEGSGRSYRGSYDRGTSNRSYRRSYKRDSMGRYTRAEDDMDDMVSELRDMMGDLPQEKQKEVQRFIQRIEQM